MTPISGVSNRSSRLFAKGTGACRTLSMKTLRCAKNFGLGAAAGTLICYPVNRGVRFIGEHLGLLDLDPKTHKKKALELLCKNNPNYDREKLENAPHYFEELTAQLNQLNGTSTSVNTIKITSIGIVGIASPIAEEILFRWLLQDVILKKTPLFVLKKMTPGKEKLVDAKITKCFRIGFVSTLFSAAHLLNQGIFPDSYVRQQIISTLFLGSICGILKESKLGLSGAIGAHIANNIVAIAPPVWRD